MSFSQFTGSHVVKLLSLVVNWIRTTRKSSENLRVEILDSCFDIIKFHQQCISWSPHWRSDQQPQNAEPKLYHWASNPNRTQVMLNQIVMVIARPINLNVSCKLHPPSLQRTLSPPGSRRPRRIGNTHPRNYYTNKGRDIMYILIF